MLHSVAVGSNLEFVLSFRKFSLRSFSFLGDSFGYSGGAPLFLKKQHQERKNL